MNIPLYVSSFQCRRWIPTLQTSRWNWVLPSNPSRLSLILTQSVGMNLQFSIFPDPLIQEGLNYGSDENYLEFKVRDQPSLTTSAWYVWVGALVPAGIVQAWEETVAGT